MRSPRNLTRSVCAAIAVVLGLATATTAVAVASAPAATASPSPQDDWSTEPLLLIHGWNDTCNQAFMPPQDPSTNWAYSFFTDAQFTTIDLVGLYDQKQEANCDSYLNPDPVPSSPTPDENQYLLDRNRCNSLPDVVSEPSSQYGTTNDPIDRLACQLAWYIYDTYTHPADGSAPRAVNVLAHSMGGLVIRLALGETQAGTAGYPPSLRVLRVVTIATPHGGLTDGYADGAWIAGGTEANEMQAGTSFMQMVNGVQKPQGLGGTFWGLIGASDALASTVCPDGQPQNGSTGTKISCANETIYSPYLPDGDGIVPATSMMAMQANVKVLYGVVDECGLLCVGYVADLSTQYEHEIATPIPVFGDLSYPYYLDDVTPGDTTWAWVCSSACNGSGLDLSDLPIGATTAVAMPHSLTEAADLLQTPVVKDVPGGGSFSTEWLATGGSGGMLGDPLGAPYAVTGGSAEDFSGGAIYYSSATGQTQAIWGPAYADYQELGGPGSFLGLPASDSITAPGGGQYWAFPGTSCSVGGLSGSGAAIYQSSVSAAGYEVHGCIYQDYLKFNGPAGPLGYPTTSQSPAGSGGYENHFAGTTCPAGTFAGTSGSAIYWDGAASPPTTHEVTGCIYQQYLSMGEASSGLGFPLDDPYPYNGGTRQDFQNGSITDSNGTLTVSNGVPWVVGHAMHAGDDYPWETIGQFDHQNEGIDPWAEYYGQCDSFTAWKVYENLAGSAAQHPSIVPAPGFTPSNYQVSPVNQNTWGNADNWSIKAAAAGYTVSQVPTPGSVAWWPNATTDPQDGHAPDSAHGLGSFGHVGYVTDVYPDGSITVEQYNMRDHGEYSVVHMAFGQPYTDTSFGQPAATIPWPSEFIHMGDGAAPGTGPTSPEPASGVVWSGYPQQVKVIGPGSSSSEFSTANVWYSKAGYGETGAMLWTHTNGGTASSTATWTPQGLAAGTCYRVDAFVPSTDSDNPVTLYTVTDAAGATTSAVNENVQTNDWSELGIFKTDGSGHITVRVDDRGASGLYVAADAIRFWRQPDCTQRANISPVMLPTSTYGTWTTVSGHGLWGSMRYATTSGSNSGTASALWAPTTLRPGLCYDVSVYVPNTDSDNPGTLYYSNDQAYGIFYPQVNENAFTNQFAPLGTFISNSDGTLPIDIFNDGPSGDYVAADAVAFVWNPTCSAEWGGAAAFGSKYGSAILGPGSGPPEFSTSGNWYYDLDHGYANHQLYTADGSGAAATWTFYGSANACYTAKAYIPNWDADNTTASYTFTTQNGTTGTTINQNTSTGWTSFSGNPRFTTGSNGTITVKLASTGSSGGYTAADAISFSSC